jgi:hypothetical protein
MKMERTSLLDLPSVKRGDIVWVEANGSGRLSSRGQAEELISLGGDSVSIRMLQNAGIG